MEENNNILQEKNETEEGFLPNIKWLLKGFTFPCWSRSFYKEAIRKRFLFAFIFFLFFVFVLTSITAIQVAISLKNVGFEITGAYERGEFPSITIEDGIARTDGQEQYIFTDKRTVVEIDTTGNSQGIDTSAYSEGFLLTHDEFHFVNDDGYQVIPLLEMHEYFGNPIILDKSNILNLWQKVALIIDLTVFIGGFFFNILARFAYIALLGLIVWGIISIKHQGIDYKIILITGIYADVPASYLFFLLKKVSITFCGLKPILLIVIWAIVMWYLLKAENGSMEGIVSEDSINQ